MVLVKAKPNSINRKRKHSLAWNLKLLKRWQRPGVGGRCSALRGCHRAPRRRPPSGLQRRPVGMSRGPRGAHPVGRRWPPGLPRAERPAAGHRGLKRWPATVHAAVCGREDANPHQDAVRDCGLPADLRPDLRPDLRAGLRPDLRPDLRTGRRSDLRTDLRPDDTLTFALTFAPDAARGTRASSPRPRSCRGFSRRLADRLLQEQRHLRRERRAPSHQAREAIASPSLAQLRPPSWACLAHTPGPGAAALGKPRACHAGRAEQVWGGARSATDWAPSTLCFVSFWFVLWPLTGQCGLVKSRGIWRLSSRTCVNTGLSCLCGHLLTVQH